MTYSVAVIGTGPGRDVDISGRSHAWAYKHGDGYAARSDCELVACADLVEEYAGAFADEFGIDDRGVFTDHEELLATAEPDIVSIVTPIPTHAPLVLDAARSGVAAIHCEKPMARTWAEARAMGHIADVEDVQLTIAHQRRFTDPVRTAKDLLAGGEIGDLERIETSYGNFFDNGTHSVDLAGYFAGEPRAEWVIGQVDYTRDHVRYGVPHAEHTLVGWEYDNGIHGVAATTGDYDRPGNEFAFFDCFIRLLGTDGVIEIKQDEPVLSLRQDGAGWTSFDVDPDLVDVVERGVDDAVDALGSDRQSELSVANALKTAEILFAGHESSRRRGRVDLPMMGVYDHPLESLLASGEVQPTEPDDRPPHPAEEGS